MHSLIIILHDDELHSTSDDPVANDGDMRVQVGSGEENR